MPMALFADFRQRRLRYAALMPAPIFASLPPPAALPIWRLRRHALRRTPTLVTLPAITPPPRRFIVFDACL